MANMVKEMSSTELRELVAPAEAMDRVTFDPRTTGEFTNDAGRTTFTAENKSYTVTPDAYGRLGQILGIPKPYLSKTPHSLMVPHMNYWLRNREIPSLVAAGTADHIEMFSKQTATPVSNNVLVNAVENVIGKDLKIYHVSHDVHNTRFSIVNEVADHEVAKGDVVRTGISIDNSYDLSNPLQVSTYVHRLACTNGAISTDNVFRMSRKMSGDDDYAHEWVENSIRQAYEASSIEVDRLRNMQGVSIERHVSDALGSVFSEFGVPLDVRDEFTNRVMDDRVATMYDLYNTVTWIASNSEASALDAAIARRMMEVGGQLASHPDVCNSCHRIVG